jgi:hypothetical protein
VHTEFYIEVTCSGGVVLSSESEREGVGCFNPADIVRLYFRNCLDSNVESAIDCTD